MEDTTKPKRYFWFCFTFTCLNGRSGTADNSLSTIGYFSRKGLMEYLKLDMAKQLNVKPSDVAIVLTNFIELNEEDYKDFIYEIKSDGS